MVLLYLTDADAFAAVLFEQTFAHLLPQCTFLKHSERIPLCIQASSFLFAQCSWNKKNFAKMNILPQNTQTNFSFSEIK